MAKKADEVRSVVYIFLNKKDIDTGHTVHIYGGRSRFIIYNLELTTYVFDLQLKEIIAGPELFYGAYSNYPDAISTENIIPKARDENEALKKPLKDINNWLAKVPISS